jgi:hypothetical protein
MMKIQLVLITEYGTFYGEFLDVDQEQYDNIVSYSKEYYLSGFEMNLEDGGFAIFSP